MINRYKIILKLIRFSIVGSISTIINYSFFFFLYSILEFYYIIASSFGYIIGLLFGYYYNKNWTFRKNVIDGKSYIINYFTAQIIGLIITQLSLFIIVEGIHIDPLFANIIALGFGSIASFLLIDLFVFNKKKKNKLYFS